MALDLEEKWVCPNCGTKMRPSPEGYDNIMVCPECGCTIEKTEQNLDTFSICPNCNQIMDDGNECPNCGYDLGSDFD
jgi:RNA polymerase subunit RPABC4/transcription elongation factor Spt4